MMCYFRRLGTTFFSCQVVFVIFIFGITLTYTASHIARADDLQLAASHPTHANPFSWHEPSLLKPESKPCPREQYDCLARKYEAVLRFRPAAFHLPISDEALAQQITNVDQSFINVTTHQSLFLPARDQQVKRIRAIVHRLAPYAPKWNEQVKDWRWEVNLVRATEMRAYGLPGGKMMIDKGILRRLRLNDHEIALLLAHQIAHALRDHMRPHLSEAPIIFESTLTPSLLFGLTHPGIALPSNRSELLFVQYSHTDETEADVIGADIAARAGYDPRATITLWRRLNNLSRSTQVDLITMHPFAKERIRDFRKRVAELLPIYHKARRKAARAAALAHSRSIKPR